MTSFELVVPINLREIVDNFKPDPAKVREMHAEALKRAKESTELLSLSLLWANAKLSVEVEILKELLATEMARNITKVRIPGRPSSKFRGIKTGRVAPKKPTTGAPVLHDLGGSTKEHTIEAYEQYFAMSEGSAKKAAILYLQKKGVDIFSDKGRALQDNLRRRINAFHLQSNGKRQRKRNGR